MTTAAPVRTACLVCRSQALTPVLRPPLLRCRSCGLVFRPLSGSGGPGTGDFEAVYRATGTSRLEQERRIGLYDGFLARYTPAPGRDRLLDVGCGDGTFLERARRAGWQVLGLEVARSAVEAGRAAGLPVVETPLSRAELPSASFDLVTFWNVLDFLTDPLGELRAARRVLVPGGRLGVRVNNLAFHAALYRVARAVSPCPPLAGMLRRQCFFSRASFDARTLRALLEQAGFGEVHIENSRPTDGDPYRTLAPRAEALARVAKRAVEVTVHALAAGSGRRWLLAPSLAATAVAGGSR